MSEAIDVVILKANTLDDHALACEVLKMFVEQSGQALRDLKALQERGTADAADASYKVVHTLKGSSRGVGATQVAQVCEELEPTLKRGEQVELARLEHAVQSAQTFIASYIAA